MMGAAFPRRPMSSWSVNRPPWWWTLSSPRPRLPAMAGAGGRPAITACLAARSCSSASHPQTKRRFVVAEHRRAAAGAGRPFEDGESGTVFGSCQGRRAETVSIEGIELKLPGPGRKPARWRTDLRRGGKNIAGGLGIDMRGCAIWSDGKWNFELVKRNQCPPLGALGRKRPGEYGMYLLARAPQSAKFSSSGRAACTARVPVGSEVIVRTGGGGGGWGDPLEARTPWRWRADVQEEFRIRRERARERYGVVFAGGFAHRPRSKRSA